MATYTGTFNWFNSFTDYLGQGVIDLKLDQFKCGLTNSANAPVATNTILTDLTQIEEAYGGYTAQIVANTTWTAQTGIIMKFDGNDTPFTASGTDYRVAHYWFIFDEAPAAPLDPLICWGQINSAGGGTDVTVTNGTTLTMQWDALNGIFRTS